MRPGSSTILFLVYWLQAGTLCSQELSVNTVLQNLNKNIQAVRHGAVDVQVYHKAAPVEDTLIFTGKVYFFKDPSSQNPYGHFVCFRQGKPHFAFDGNFYQFHNREKKIFRHTVPENGGLTDLIQESFALQNGLFLPCLQTGSPAFELENYKDYSLDTNLRPIDNILVLQYQNSDIHNFESGANTPDTIRYDIQYTLSLPDYNLRTVAQWRYFPESTEYLRLDFSPIQALPVNTTLEKIIDWNTLFNEGYRMIHIDR